MGSDEGKSGRSARWRGLRRMMEAIRSFPYGAAPLWILVAAMATGGALVVSRLRMAAREEKVDLVFLTFAKDHFESYIEPVKRFEKKYGVKIRMELVDGRALQSRLQSAMLAGTDVPDMAEIEQGAIHYFIRGPLEDVGFRDITDRLIAEKYWDPSKPEEENKLVGARLSIWMSRGRIFALPHDVHPVCLLYRADLVEKLFADPAIRAKLPDGIRSVEDLDTWDKFTKFGRAITADLTGDGVPDRYALDLASNGSGTLRILLLQRGGALFTREGQVAFDSEIVADTIYWYLHQVEGPGRIAYSAGWGQTLAKAVLDGLVLFYFSPDWRTKFFEREVPRLGARRYEEDVTDHKGKVIHHAGEIIRDASGLAKYPGKIRVMPLPAWKPGGRRTSVWGGTGIVITKRCRKPELAWKLCKFLYYDEKELGKRFKATNIIPPFKSRWKLPAFNRADPFFGNQKIGQVYAALAPSTPADYRTPYTELAQQKVDEAFANSQLFYRENVLDASDAEARARADEELKQYIRSELKRTAAHVRRTMDHNVFLRREKQEAGQ